MPSDTFRLENDAIVVLDGFISAFANDWANLGGGCVVCGAKQERDEHGFPRLAMVGLTATRLKEVEARVLAGCRDSVSPSIAPIIEELPTDSPERRVISLFHFHPPTLPALYSG